MAGRVLSGKASDSLTARWAERDRGYWLAVLGGGLVGMAAAVLPGLRLGISVARGGGETQVSYTVWRELNFAWGAAPLSPLYLVGAAMIVAVGLLGLRARGRPVRAALTALVVALTAVAAVHLGTLWNQPQPRWPVPHTGGHGCQLTRDAAGQYPSNEFDPRRVRCGGAFLAPAIDEFLADTGRAHPELDLAHPYRLTPLVGAWGLWLVSVALFWWSICRAARVRDWAPRLSLASTFGVILALAVSCLFASLWATAIGVREGCYDEPCDQVAGVVAPWIFLLSIGGGLTLLVVRRAANRADHNRPME